MKKRECRIFSIALLLALAVCFLAACVSGQYVTQESTEAAKGETESTEDSGGSTADR